MFSIVLVQCLDRGPV